MPLTPFQKRKLEKIFAVLDLNADGRLDPDDYVHRVEAFARLSGWPESSPEYERNMRFAMDEWQNLCESADLDADGGVTREGFLRWGDVFLDDRDAVRAYARGDVQLLFDAMDGDGDGRVGIDEYRVYLDVCGIDASGADAFFEHADIDRDGLITRTEMAHAMEEFLLSEDPAAGGNFLFGPLDLPVRRGA